MNVITPIEDSYVLLNQGGTYIESKLFYRGDHVFTEVKGGFARLHTSGMTSISRLSWSEPHTSQGTIKVVGCEVHFIPHVDTRPRARVPRAVAAK